MQHPAAIIMTGGVQGYALRSPGGPGHKAESLALLVSHLPDASLRLCERNRPVNRAVKDSRFSNAFVLVPMLCVGTRSEEKVRPLRICASVRQETGRSVSQHRGGTQGREASCPHFHAKRGNEKRRDTSLRLCERNKCANRAALKITCTRS